MRDEQRKTYEGGEVTAASPLTTQEWKRLVATEDDGHNAGGTGTARDPETDTAALPPLRGRYPITHVALELTS